jgi:ABC-type multidrug transport system ATPase subunit
VITIQVIHDAILISSSTIDMEVSLQSVSFFDFDVNVPDLGSKKKMEKYLDKASLSISAGSVVAVIGSPTYSRHLLELISLRKRKGHIAGHVNHDSSIRKNGSHFRDIAYVKDFDSHYFDYLTVFDFLWWAARLRLTLSLAECSTRAREAALLVDLNCLSWVRELNSGQRILLALASELVSSPSLICVESPIDFKEEAHALSVAKMFNKVAHRVNTSTTIVFSCLAPSYRVLQCVDQIVVQFEAKILYSSGMLFDKSEFVLHPGRDDSTKNPQKQETVNKILEVVSTVSREILRSGYGSSYSLGKGTGMPSVTSGRRGGSVTAQSHFLRENVKLLARVEKHVEELVKLHSTVEQLTTSLSMEDADDSDAAR